MALKLTPLAVDAATSAVCALLNGGTLDLYAGATRLVSLTFASPAFDRLTDQGAEAAPLTPGFAVGQGAPNQVRCLTAGGELVASGSSHGLVLDPGEMYPGVRVTLDSFVLACQ